MPQAAGRCVLCSPCLFVCLWMPSSATFLALKAFALALALGGTEASFFTFGSIFVERVPGFPFRGASLIPEGIKS